MKGGAYLRPTNTLIRYINLLYYAIDTCDVVFKLYINFGIYPLNWKTERVIKSGEPKDLVGGYRPLGFTSGLGKTSGNSCTR